MDLSELVRVSRSVAATRSRNEKVELLAGALARLAPEEAELGIALLAGAVPGGKLNVGFAQVHAALESTTPGSGILPLAELRAEMEALRTLRGPGSASERARRLAALFARLGTGEREFLGALWTGGVRQGALEGVMEEALARAARVPVSLLRRAAMLTGNLPQVGAEALAHGEPALAACSIELFRPLAPMLADSAEDTDEALAELGRAALEYKLDGARVQVHKSGSEVRVFSRLLNDVTPACPEIVEAVGALEARELVLDGEALALDPNGRPHPFQVTMRRFGRKLEVGALRAELPLAVVLFDLLQLDGTPWIDRPAAERFAALQELVPPELSIPRLVTADPDEARAFLERALAAGHEGLLAKSLAAPYEAGRRGGSWLKVKRAHTLDLVVLAAEWGSGRRSGWLSNLHLGARDEEHGGFVMLGKTFKGLTDELLGWQTRELLAREVAREGAVVHVRPELVVEIAVNELQASRRYPGGLAVRFARVKRYRSDKSAAEADTIATARALHERGLQREPASEA